MHPQTVLRRRYDALDEEYGLLCKWMPRGCKEHAYNSYLDFMHFPQAVATSHAKARLKERKNVTGCVKGVYVEGTNRTVVATCLPCRATNATPIRCVRSVRDNKKTKKEMRKLYANAKDPRKNAKCAAAYLRLDSYIQATSGTVHTTKEVDTTREELAEARRRRSAVSNPRKIRMWDNKILALQAQLHQ